MMKNSNKAVPPLGNMKFMLCQNSEPKEYSNSALRPQSADNRKKCFSYQKEEMVIPGK